MLVIDGIPLAFTFQYFQFIGKFKKHLKKNFNKDLEESEVENVEVTWRYQKNGDNGQKINQTNNRAIPKFSSVEAAMRIR